MKYNANPKIFIGLGDTCGYYSNLEKGFIDNHVKCEFVNAFPMRNYKRICRSSSYIGTVVEYLGYKRWTAKRGSKKRIF